MGRFLKIQKLTNAAEVVIIAVGLAVVLTGVYFFAPGLRVAVSKQLTGLDINTDRLDNVTKGAQLPVASETPSTEVSNKGLIRIAQYAWNGNAGMIAANGGPRTTEGSLMEAAGVNLELVRQDMVGGLRDMQIKFVEEFDKGVAYPKSDKSAFAVSIMGDGVPYFISTAQQEIDQKFGKGKYHIQNIGAIGLSYGEDKLIGPKIWKDNPKSMIDVAIWLLNSLVDTTSVNPVNASKAISSPGVHVVAPVIFLLTVLPVSLPLITSLSSTV